MHTKHIFPLLALLPLSAMAQQPIRSAIHFHSDRHDLTPLATIVLDTVCATADQQVPYRLVLTAHTDADGSTTYNEALSQRRANTALETLRQCGVQITEMQVTCQGEANPVADNATEIGKARNRRVELYLEPLGHLPTLSEVRPAPSPAPAPLCGPSLQNLLSEPAFTVTNLDPSQNQWVGDASGATFFIPKNAFDGQAGTNFTCRWRSLTKLSDLVRTRTETTTQSGPLVSAGMGEIQVLADGKPIQPKPGKMLALTVPKPEVDGPWSGWQGKRGTDGIMRWSNNGKPGYISANGGRQNLKEGVKEASRGKSKSRRGWFRRRRKGDPKLWESKSPKGGYPTVQQVTVDRAALKLSEMATSKYRQTRVSVPIYTGAGNCDFLYSLPNHKLTVYLASDSSQLVLVHNPSIFTTIFAVPKPATKSPAAEVSWVPQGDGNMLIVIRSTPQGMELAMKKLPTVDRDIEVDAASLTFVPVSEEELYDRLDNLQSSPTALLSQ